MTPIITAFIFLAASIIYFASALLKWRMFRIGNRFDTWYLHEWDGGHMHRKESVYLLKKEDHEVKICVNHN